MRFLLWPWQLTFLKSGKNYFIVKFQKIADKNRLRFLKKNFTEILLERCFRGKLSLWKNKLHRNYVEKKILKIFFIHVTPRENTLKKIYDAYWEKKLIKKNSRCFLEGQHCQNQFWNFNKRDYLLFAWNRLEIDNSDVKTAENIENYYWSKLNSKKF
jgi:hypothetical protein